MKTFIMLHISSLLWLKIPYYPCMTGQHSYLTPDILIFSIFPEGSAHTVLTAYWSEKLGKKKMLGNET